MPAVITTNFISNWTSQETLNGVNPLASHMYQNSHVSEAALSPDGKTFTVASSHSDKETVEFLMSSGEALSTFSPEEGLGKFTFSGDSRLLITSSDIRGNIGNVIATYDSLVDSCNGVAASYDGNVIALKNAHTVAIYNSDGKFKRNLKIPNELSGQNLGEFALSPDGTFIALALRVTKEGDSWEKIHLFNVKDGEHRGEIHRKFSDIKSLEISHHKNLILVGSNNTNGCILSKWEPDCCFIREVELPKIFSLKASSDGNTVVFKTSNSELQVLHYQNHITIDTKSEIQDIHVSLNGKVFGATSPNAYQLWKI